MNDWRKNALLEFCEQMRAKSMCTLELIAVEYIEASLKDGERKQSYAHALLTSPLYNPKEEDHQ